MAHYNNLQAALELGRSAWFIKDPDIIMAAVNGLISGKSSGSSLEDYHITQMTASGEIDESAPDSKEKGSVVIIVPLHGTMTKYETCTTYGTADIASTILKYAGKDEVAGFVLDIDSGGGSSNSIVPLTRAISKVREMGKPIIAHCDACYSAAYWVASQCDAVFADNILSGFGSIGAYAEYLDTREDKSTGFKTVTVYARESPDKNIAYREMLDGKPEKMQDELSKLVTQFHSEVRAGRPQLQADSEGVFTGADFVAQEAIAIGLADGFADLEACVENVLIRSEYND